MDGDDEGGTPGQKVDPAAGSSSIASGRLFMDTKWSSDEEDDGASLVLRRSTLYWHEVHAKFRPLVSSTTLETRTICENCTNLYPIKFSSHKNNAKVGYKHTLYHDF